MTKLSYIDTPLEVIPVAYGRGTAPTAVLRTQTVTVDDVVMISARSAAATLVQQSVPPSEVSADIRAQITKVPYVEY
jgi:hypothetical protein